MQVPDGWKLSKIGKHVDCLTGFAFKSSEYSDNKNGVRLLRGDNIEPGRLRWGNAKLWSKKKLDNLERYQLSEGDFVIALDRTWIASGLKVAEVTEADLPCLLVQRVIRIRANQTLEQSLLSQFFSGYGFEQYVKSVQTATAVPHISPNDIKKFVVALPPLKEQRKIAQILSTWDKAISTTEQLLNNSQQQKKALIQQLLTGKKRLRDDKGQRFSGEWEKKFVKEIGRVITGNTPPKSEADNYGGNILWATAEDFTDKYIFNTAQRLTEKGAEEAKVLPKGSVLVTCIASIGKNAIAADAMGTNQQINAVLVNHAYSNEFFYYQICFNKNKLLALAGVTAVPIVNKGAFEKIKLSMPSLEEQQKIAAVLSVADKEITTLEQKINQLKQEKKALMQQLLTGKRRVQLKEATE